MSGSRPRMAWTGSVLAATSLTALALTTVPATAVSGPQAPDSVAAATARLDIGGQRGCSATLVAKQWLLTAASCFAETQGAAVQPGAPKLKTTAAVGASAQQVVNLVPRTDRDVVLAQLAKPVTGVTPLSVTGSAPTAGDEVQAAGFGRTHQEWVPDQVHAAGFTVQNTAATTLDLVGKSDGAAICKGDTGGPLLSTTGAVVGVSSLSWQGGCLGTDAAETRTGAVAARVDDLATWVQQVTYAPVFAAAPWKHAVQMTAGHYTSPVGGSRRMDVIVVWDDGEVTLYQGGDGKDAAHPFSAEYQLEPEKSIWTHAADVTGVNTGGTTDGVVVRWSDGEMTLYNTVDAKGFHGEKQLAPAKDATWRDDARLLTGGRFTTGGGRDDLLVDWKDGHVSLFSDLSVNGLKKQTQVVAKNTTWTHATQLTTGSFTGKNTDDLLVRWVDGETTIYSGMTGKLPGEIQIRPEKSYWTNAAAITAGALTGDTTADDILVRWNDGHVSYFSGVDARGLHTEIQLAPVG
ncbi:trypsin-like serine protease [Streptomyces sp. NPDC001843]|uniref:trypsin-like serine protease n=1 Tax=Streptomyces sp. NPDC001843 TaxID=3364617 RepID=UPI0036C2BDC7